MVIGFALCNKIVLNNNKLIINSLSKFQELVIRHTVISQETAP